MNRYYINTRAFLSVGIAACTAVILFLPVVSHAATCTFDRDLQLNVMGEDVRCLQVYLNGAGFQIAATGAGAPGKETGEYKALTEAAVIKWQQANKINPAQGYFGARSRAVYQSLVSGGSAAPAAPAPAASASGNALIDELLAKINTLKEQQSAGAAPAPVKSTSTPNKSAANKEVNALMLDVLDLLDDAEEAIDDNDDNDVQEDAYEDLRKVEADFRKALRAYFDGDYDEAEDLLKDVEGSVEDIIDDVGGESEKQEAEDLIDELKDQVDEVEEEIEIADSEGEATSEAEDLLDEAEDVLDEAEMAYDEGDYEEALDRAEEAEDLLNDALDAIGQSGNSNDVEEMLDDARDELDDARDEVDSYIDEGDDVGDAEDLLDEAEDLLDEAEDALDADDENEAEDLIDEALDLIDEALDEL